MISWAINIFIHWLWSMNKSPIYRLRTQGWFDLILFILGKNQQRKPETELITTLDTLCKINNKILIFKKEIKENNLNNWTSNSTWWRSRQASPGDAHSSSALTLRSKLVSLPSDLRSAPSSFPRSAQPVFSVAVAGPYHQSSNNKSNHIVCLSANNCELF